MMSNNNLPLNGSHALPQTSSTREEDIKRLAERILLNMPLDNHNYPIFIVSRSSYVIVNDVYVLSKKKPKTYIGFLHVKDVSIQESYDNNEDMTRAMRDITGAFTKVRRHTIVFEVYNDNTFFGITSETVSTYTNIPGYYFDNEQDASAILSYIMTRFKAKYPKLAQLITPRIFAHENSYNPELYAKITNPSENFIQLLQQMFQNAEPKTRKEQIEEEISRKNEEIKRLQAEIKRIKIEIKELEAEKEKSSQEIPISEKRITSVIKEIEQRASY